MTGAILGGQELTDRITEITLANITSDGFGVTFLSEEMDASTEKITYVDGHISLIRLRFGQKLGAFAELGFGFKGLIYFEINLKL